MTDFVSSLSQDRLDAITEALNNKEVKVSPCRNCNSDTYVILEVNEILQTRSSPGQEDPIHMPYVLIVCNGCGRKSEFSAAVLGIG